MPKIVSLQVLRGVAATMVAGFHLHEASLSEGADPGIFRFFAGGEVGVDIFFVISGFIIFYIAKSRENLTYKKFIKARFWRIIPPYWTIVSLYILSSISLALFFGDASNLPSLQSVIISFLLLPYPDHIIIIAWTLSLEIIFYIVFSFSFYIGGTRLLIISMFNWIIISQYFSLFSNIESSLLSIPLNTVILEFLFGILIAMHFLSAPGRKGFRLQVIALVAGAAGILAIMIKGDLHLGPFGREITAGIPAALLVYGLIGLNVGKQKILQIWGDSSYILYLFHILFFSIVGRAIEELFGLNVYHSNLSMLFLLIAVVLISGMATVLVERPYQHWYKGRINSAIRQ